MLFNLEDIVVWILSKRQLKELAMYSPQYIARLEKAASGSLDIDHGQLHISPLTFSRQFLQRSEAVSAPPSAR